MRNLKPGDRIRLTTDNERLDGALGTISRLASWGAFVSTTSAATGEYRAGWEEMIPLEGTNGTVKQAKENGYVGDPCQMCGSMRTRRDGFCTLCDDCGATSGCS